MKKPEFKFTLSKADAAAVTELLESLTAFRARNLAKDKKLNKLVQERDQVSEKIATLEGQSHKAEVARELPALREQLAALHPLIEQQERQQVVTEEMQHAMSGVWPVLAPVMAPLINAEVKRLAEPIAHLFRSKHSACAAVAGSDYIRFLKSIYLSHRNQVANLDPIIRIVEATLRGEVPFEYDPNPTPNDLYADANSDLLGTSGRLG